ncbi:hypothetical protein [Arthrobacter sp. efr-133-R2A-63]|uniref:hypothetical protein n=1 Tax=Arthrobacter sp. efr-133-R2A-63 TaxID=3040278 RepID=UPI00254C67E3|nr:hypothetical protein [Arthrobacter sp. efr-133-R2A-63]
MSTETRTRKHVWTCHYCKKSIRDGAGYVDVPGADVYRLEKAEQTWREDHPYGGTLKELLGLPNPAAWVATHTKCDPHPEKGSYRFDVAEARTTEDILDWTLHLMDKTWMEFTDWTDFIRNHMAENGTVLDA